MGKVTTIPPSRGSSFGRPGLGHHLRQAAALAFAMLLIGAAPAAAQQSQGIVGPGNAVVTGFSGTSPNQAPDGGDPFDYLSIDLNGPSARVRRPLHPRPARPGVAGRQAFHRHRVAGRSGLRRGAGQFAAAEHLSRGDLRLWHLDLRPRPERGDQAHPYRRRRRAVPARPVRSAGPGWRTGFDLAHRWRDRRGHPLRDHRFRGPGRGVARRSRLRPAHAAALRRRTRHRPHPSPVA